MSVRHAFEVMAVLADAEERQSAGLGVVRVAERVGIDKSQASRVLKLLAEHGMVERHPCTREYRLGWQVVAMTQVVGRRELVRVGRRATTSLAMSLGGSASVCVLSRDEAVTVMTSGEPTPAGSPADAVGLGRRQRACASAAGRVLLAGLPEGEAMDLHPEGCPRRHGTAAGTEALVDQLARIREAGHEVVRAGAGGVVVAVPVRDPRARCAAALVATSQLPVADRKGLDRMLAHVRAAARTFGSHLGAGSAAVALRPATL